MFVSFIEAFMGLSFESFESEIFNWTYFLAKVLEESLFVVVG